MLLLLVLQIIATMQVFTEPFTMTGGGPKKATMTVLMLIYNYTFQNAEFGESSALGGILFFVLAVFLLIYMRLATRVLAAGWVMGAFTPAGEGCAPRAKRAQSRR